MSKVCYLAALAVVAGAIGTADTHAAALNFAGSETDIGGTFFPGGAAPYVVVPWRSETNAKNFDLDGNNVYGSAGYAMFATQFNWPNQGCCGSSQPFASATYPNLISLPSFVSGSLNLVNNKVGGWGYALVDDPTLVNGYRDFNWGNTQVPPVVPANSQSPYVKIGGLEGTDVLGNNPRTSAVGAGRWAFTVGADVPKWFRVGVMTDGLDANNWASTEVLLHQVSGANAIIGTATSGAVVRNRFVDIHTFDIVNAQPGDTFAIFSKASSDGWGSVAGVTFDVTPEPTSALLFACMFAVCGSKLRRTRSK